MIKANILELNLLNSYKTELKKSRPDDEFARIYDDSTKKNNEFSTIYKKFEKTLKEQDKMFKLFDLSLIYNQLMFGNADRKKRSELLQKSLKLSRELSNL